MPAQASATVPAAILAPTPADEIPAVPAQATAAEGHAHVTTGVKVHS